ncbi:MAG: dnaA1 [Chlamydiia bacterium]|nr:dnaA1 [Chlamydiia bacterium]
MHTWENFLKEQESEFGKETVDRWLRSLQVLRFDACNLYLEAKDSFQTLWFEEHIRPKLKNFVNNNHSPIKVHLALKGAQSTKKGQEGVEKRAEKADGKQRKAVATPSFTINFEELDPTHVIDEFIPTSDNLIVIKLLEELHTQFSEIQYQQLSNKVPFSIPKNSINPIYLYGPAGSGKTHLLQATAQKFKNLGLQVIYARCDLFTDHVVRAIRAAEMPKFREIYRRADVLIIDDVHELAKKTATQEEFFHTFNTLHTAGKQIILSANVAPQHLQHIEPRLVSRFEWGISLQLTTLEKKEIVELIEKRAALLNLSLHERTIEFLAETFASNTKAIMRAEQALMLRTHLREKQHKLEPKAPITLAQAKTLLADIIEEEESHKLTSDKIIHTVAEFYGIRAEDVTGKSQNRECMLPRQLSMHLCRHLLKLPYMKIGDLFARDHSTVMSAIRGVEKQLNSDGNDIRSTINALEQRLAQSKR